MGDRTKERPIIFSGAMVRAILEKRKTQTRRVIKPQPVCAVEGAYFDAYNGGPQWNWWDGNRVCNGDTIVRCPYGKPGDRLWVREVWRRAPEGLADGIQYRAGNLLIYWDRTADAERCRALANKMALPRDGKWRSPIFMPRWASRCVFVLTEVRVQGVQDISDEDCEAEGIEYVDREPGFACWRWSRGQHYENTPRRAFRALWDSINAKRRVKNPQSVWILSDPKTEVIDYHPWESNPWVWALTFREATE